MSDPDQDVDKIADRLYALRPDEFAAARDAEVKQARAAGQQPLARELAKLRKPTQSAWLINLLWRDQRDVVDQLLQLAEEMGRAQEQASGAALQRLTAQRRQLEHALVQQAKALGEKAGVSVSASMEREAQETLAAALAQPEVADEIRSGRLVKPAAYAGFGTLPTSAPRLAADRPRAEPAEEPTRIDEVAARRQRERRAAAERRVDEARTDVKTAASALESEGDKADTARAEQQALRAQIDKLTDQLKRLQHDEAAAERSALTASRNRDHAEKAHAAALRALEQAERELKELG